MAAPSILCLAEFADRLNHPVRHLTGHARIDAYPESVVHDEVGVGQLSDDAVALSRAAHLVKRGMFDEIAGKEVARLYLPAFEKARKVVAREAGVVLDGDEKSEPRRI